MMNALDFLRVVPQPAVKPVYALVGDEAYLRAETIDVVLRAALGREQDLDAYRVSGESAGLADVLDELRTLPFLTRRRIVVVDAADKFVTAHRKALEQYVEKPSATGVLVLCVKSWVSTTNLAKKVAQAGVTIDCKPPGERELPEWMIGRARDHLDCELRADAARLLLELVGPDVGLLASELEKLAVYVGDAHRITRQDVSQMVGAGRVETIWRTLEAATTGQAAEAMAWLERLLTAGEHPIGMLAASSASLRKVYHAGLLRMRKMALADACREAGVPSFRPAIDLVGRQHTHLGPTRVKSLPRRLLRADLDCKGFSQLPQRLILEQLLIELAQGRDD